MAEANPYSSQVEVPEPTVTPTATETANTSRDAFEKKMTDKAFFAYMQKKTGGELSTFLADETDAKLTEEAETYDRDVAPTLEKFKTFLGGEFASKLRLIPAEGKRKVMDKIDDFLLGKAVENPAKFAEYGAKIDKFAETSAKADALEQSLSQYGKTAAEQKAVAAAMEQGVKNADAMLVKNKADFDAKDTAAYSDAMAAQDKAGRGPINALRKFGNRLRGKPSMTGEQMRIGEEYGQNRSKDQALLDNAQDAVIKQQDELKARAAEIATGHTDLEAFNTEIDAGRKELLEYFGEAQEVRTLLLDQIRLAVDAGKYNPENGADTMEAYQSMWKSDDGGEGDDVREIMKTIYRKEIDKIADQAKDAVRPDKLQDFTNFLVSYTDETSREIVKEALDKAIEEQTDKSSPRAAQLGMMKRRLGSIK